MPHPTPTLLDRFLRYVRIDTRADDRTDAYPSSPGQLVLGALLRDELCGLGLDARQDAHGLVFATIPGNVPGAPTIAFNAHVDTNPENSGENVDPQVIRDYPGGDLVLPKDPSKVIRVADNPDLAAVVGKTVITTDGTTLLGADDKAGVAVIMEAARILTENPDIPHGPVQIVFTCDEEIGRGVLHLEPAVLGGAVVGYTLDGMATGEIEDETFSADAATVTITGVNIHPSIAKGRMTNAVRLAGLFLDRLPKRRLSPETTAGREGFIHPLSVEGGVGEVTVQFILRDFDTAQLAVEADILREIGRQVEREYPEAKVAVAVRKQYRNMRDGITREPRAVRYAAEATRRAGLEPKFKIIRGGTDGAQLTEKGLPTPNLSTGEHNPHSPLEWTCLEEMEAAVRVVVELVQVWAGK